MANSLKKNSYYVDSEGTITVETQKPIIMGILITPNAAESRVIIKESVSGTTVIDVRVAIQESRYISFEAFNGIEVTDNFEIDTLTAIDSVILYGHFMKIANTAR
jgi:hypothetical protein